MPLTSVTNTAGIKKRNRTTSQLTRIHQSIARIEKKVGRVNLLAYLREATAQCPKPPSDTPSSLQTAHAQLGKLMVALNKDITHDISWNDLLVRVSEYAAERATHEPGFLFDVSKFVDDMTDYQTEKWEASNQVDFGEEAGYVMHPKLDASVYTLCEGNCYYGVGTLRCSSGQTDLVYSGQWRDGHLVDGTLVIREPVLHTAIDDVVVTEYKDSAPVKRGAFAVRKRDPSVPFSLVAHGPCKDIKNNSCGLWHCGKFKKRFNFKLNSDKA